MNVLFVCSGNSESFEVTPFIKSQGNSLEKAGIKVDYYLIKDQGGTGYFKNIFPLRRQIKENEYDIVHSHYALSGWVTAFTGTSVPKVISYMGSDVLGNSSEEGNLKPSSVINILASKFLQFFVEKIIVKSPNIKEALSLQSKISVLPNGVGLSEFRPMEKQSVRKKLDLKKDARYVLFLGSKTSNVKNYQLLEHAKAESKKDFTILTPYPVPHKKVPLYLNAADVLALTSYKEGSPNVIKEAMACNTPIVSTDVGDVEWVLGETAGCYLSTFEPEVFAKKITKALEYSGRTNGRDRIKKLGLDTETVAKRLVDIYETII